MPGTAPLVCRHSARFVSFVMDVHLVFDSGHRPCFWHALQLSTSRVLPWSRSCTTETQQDRAAPPLTPWLAQYAVKPATLWSVQQERHMPDALCCPAAFAAQAWTTDQPLPVTARLPHALPASDTQYCCPPQDTRPPQVLGPV